MIRNAESVLEGRPLWDLLSTLRRRLEFCCAGGPDGAFC